MDKNIKLILCDLDGTLLDDDKHPDMKVKSLIQGSGIKMTFVSGRNFHIIQDLVQDYEIELPYVTNNGANIFLKDQCIYEKSIDVKELYSSLEILENNSLPYLAYTNNVIYCQGNHPALEKFKKRLIGKCTIENACDKEEIIGERIFKIVTIHQSNNFMKKIMKQIDLQCPQTHCVRSEGDIYTITNRLATKGNAISWLLDYLGVDPNNVIAFGDNYNDVSMFEAVKYSVAMENADPSIQERANFVTKSNQEQGVSWFIQNFL